MFELTAVRECKKSFFLSTTLHNKLNKLQNDYKHQDLMQYKSRYISDKNQLHTNKKRVQSLKVVAHIIYGGKFLNVLT